MHALWSLEGEFESLFVFHSNSPSNRIPLEDIFIHSSVQLQDLLNHLSILKLHFQYLPLGVVNQTALPISPVADIAEGYLDNEPIDLHRGGATL